MGDYFDVVSFAGIVFACGLPGWVITRAAFAWVDKRKDHDLGELARDVKEIIR